MSTENIYDRQQQAQELEISLRHNQLGDISPFQQKRIRKRAWFWLRVAAVLLVLGSALVLIPFAAPEWIGPGGGGLPHQQQNNPATELLILGSVMVIIGGASAIRWWQLEADIDDGRVLFVDGKATERKSENGSSSFYIDTMRFSTVIAEGIPHTKGRPVRGYYLPRTRLLLAVDVKADDQPPLARP